MNYTNGNFNAFAQAPTLKNKTPHQAYIIGNGLASLSAAAFLIRDGHMDGQNITVFKEPSPTGSQYKLDKDAGRWYIVREEHELEEHSECFCDLFRSIPSIDTEGASVLDEIYWLDQSDPNVSPMRTMEKCAAKHGTDRRYSLSDASVLELGHLIITSESELSGKRIKDVLSRPFFRSDFWLLWRTMFGFEEWHSAIEMRRYLTRFIHHIKRIPDLSCMKFARYNAYDSLILPLYHYLESCGVSFVKQASVTDMDFETIDSRKYVRSFSYTDDTGSHSLSLSEKDLVFMTLGSSMDRSGVGDDHHPVSVPKELGSPWVLWQTIAKKSPDFGHPDAFCGNTGESNCESATITCIDDAIPKVIEQLLCRNPKSGKTVTGGIVTVKDSAWLMSWSVSRQPHFRMQEPNETVVWLYGLFSSTPGNYVQKALRNCTGQEIVMEWLYHLGVPAAQIPELSTHAHCMPCMMPFCRSHFMARKAGDRPDVVPKSAANFAFIGPHVETKEDAVFPTEYDVRTAMEAVYTLLSIKRGVPEVYSSAYDIRALLQTIAVMMDGRKLTDLNLSFEKKFALKKALKAIQGTIVDELLKEYHLL